MGLTYYIILAVILIIGIVLWLLFKPNFFTKHKYVRLETYNDDMSLTVK